VDLASGQFDRFSFDVAEDESPVWSPDGRQIAYTTASIGEQRHIFVKSVDSGEKERLVYTGKRLLHVDSWSPDGRWLAFHEYHPRSLDVWLLDLNDTSQRVPVANTSAIETDVTFSPDGRSLAYASTETGRFEVYVVSFPNLSGKQQVSREGGMQPRWSESGHELFFSAPPRIMMARRGAGPTAWQNPVPLFEAPTAQEFVPAPDGRSFYVIASNPDAPAREIRVVQNWFEELKCLVPTK
jgi:Tol biopolymer transport system component